MERGGGVIDDFLNFVGFFLQNSSIKALRCLQRGQCSSAGGWGEGFAGRKAPSELCHGTGTAKGFCG